MRGVDAPSSRRVAFASVTLLAALYAFYRLRVEIIVAGDSAAIGPARQVTKTLPIVMTVSGDPVMRGFVASLGRPGGNGTRGGKGFGPAEFACA